MKKILPLPVFEHTNPIVFYSALPEIITQAQKEDVILAILQDLGKVIFERLTIEMGEILDKHGFVMEVKDEPVLNKPL